MEKIKLLQVGCGKISKAWLECFLKRNDVQIVGLVDLNKETSLEKKELFNLDCEIFSDLERAINVTNPNVVIDNTTPEFHHEIVTKAIENGCHVFGEKPMADTIENAIEMVKKANDNKKYYFIMQNRRFNRHIRGYREIIKSGSIGELGFLSATFFLGPHFRGFQNVMDSPLILDMAIHTFDQARFISGCDPVTVYCHEFNPKGSWFNGSASACCIFEMTNGTVFSFVGSWCAVGNPTSWESEWRAMGSCGSAIWDGKNEPNYEIEIPSLEFQKFYEFERIKPGYTWYGQISHAGCINEMLMALKEHRSAETDSNDNIKSFAMVMAAKKSSIEGRKVLISELI